MGERMRSLSNIIASPGDDAELRTWLRANLGPGFLADVPMEQHLAVFKQLRKDIGANTIDRVERSGPDEFALQLMSVKDSSRYRVLMQLRPSDALISGLGVEKE